MKLKLFAVGLIIAGLLLIGYPKLSASYQDAQQEKLMQQWQQAMLQIHNGDESEEEVLAGSTEGYRPDVDDNEPTELVHSVDMLDEDEAPSTTTTTGKPDISNYKGVEGILSIASIDLSLPILRGATDKNMKTTVASIENTGSAGKIGNYAIAGHRNFAYGRNFNRLDEMKEGDVIEVDTGNEQHEYIVTEKLYVKPEEVWVLEGNDVDREITLVTCHPMKNPTHRLIIKGKIID